MNPVHLHAFLGALLVIGLLAGCQGATQCSKKHTCEAAKSCLAKHGGSANLDLLFPCPDRKGNSTYVCCPTLESPEAKAMARNSSMKLFDMETCGRETSDRIKNGFEAKSGEFPWMVLLGYAGTKEPTKYEFFCGGSLITRQVVLTAAHCLYTPQKMLKVVRLGELDVRSDPDCLPDSITGMGEICAPRVVQRKVTGYFKHEQYSLKELKNDIGLVWMDQPITISDTIRPICLPFNSRTLLGEGVKLRVSGWGKLDHNNDVGSPVLRWTYVNTSSIDDCNALLGPGNRQVTTKQICASGYNEEDACKGDSGGPLMNLDPEISAAVQVGIVSYGVRECGTMHSPTVYTRVSQYINWVLETIQKKK